MSQRRLGIGVGILLLALAGCSSGSVKRSTTPASVAPADVSQRTDTAFAELLARGAKSSYKVEYASRKSNTDSRSTVADFWVAQRGTERTLFQDIGQNTSWWYADSTLWQGDKIARFRASLRLRKNGELWLCSEPAGCTNFGVVTESDSIVGLTTVMTPTAVSPNSGSLRFSSYDKAPSQIAGRTVTCRSYDGDGSFDGKVCADSETGVVLMYDSYPTVVTALRVLEPIDSDFQAPGEARLLDGKTPGTNGDATTGSDLFKRLNAYRALTTFAATYNGTEDEFVLAQRPPLRLLRTLSYTHYLQADKTVVICGSSGKGECKSIGKPDAQRIEDFVGIAAEVGSRGISGRGAEASAFGAGALPVTKGPGDSSLLQNRLIFGRLSLCGGAPSASPDNGPDQLPITICLDRQTGAVTAFDADTGASSFKVFATKFSEPSAKEFVVPGPITK